MGLFLRGLLGSRYMLPLIPRGNGPGNTLESLSGSGLVAPSSDEGRRAAQATVPEMVGWGTHYSTRGRQGKLQVHRR